MTSAHELAGKIEADKEQVAQIAGQFAAAKQAAEEAAAKMRELGAEGMAVSMEQAVTELEEAESGRATLEGSLEKARWQVMAAIHGIGPGAPKAPSQEKMDERLGGLDVMPPHERHGRNPTGDELMGIDSSVGPFQKEHENANADRNLNPFARGARSAVRNSGDFKQAVEELSKPAFTTMKNGWKPPTDTYPTVGVAEPAATFTAPQQVQADFQNPMGNLVVVAVLVTDWAARGIRNWRGKS
ncbi:hypothetical protein L0U85_02065 [Glycomyces sp. L485]|uniref:hypothetical protein n=1 Tax=Glycomyces sp. L485 TaxID=2909235 RepID=UPI001F4A9F69|nr:hypothetical protein [Glycomyces sp. L485]MCH7229652.1 hypothetical protein [Glycomyces sp. L485]